MQSSPGRIWQNTGVLFLSGVFVLACILALFYIAGVAAGTGTPAACTSPPGTAHVPVFPDPVEKQKDLGDPAYTRKLLSEAIAYEPLLAVKGTQVHMGFYSGKGNHGSLLRLLDAVNSAPVFNNTPNRAIWAQGVDDYYQFPSWVRMMDEHWYERANAVNGTVTIFGKPYPDPYPVTIVQADEIWAQYSRRFAEMARPVAQGTERPVKVWCFVQGAKPDRIFYTSEYVTLQQLEKEGVVDVYFAKSPVAEWDNPADWINGTANAPPPAR